jgi:hypothetical protein
MKKEVLGFALLYDKETGILAIEQPSGKSAHNQIILSKYDLIPLKDMVCELIGELIEDKEI